MFARSQDVFVKIGVEKLLNQGIRITFYFIWSANGQDFTLINDRDAVGHAKSKIAIV